MKRVVLSLFVLLVLATSCIHTDAKPTVGAQAPDFELFNLDSQSVRLSDYLGHPVVINFWGTQCDYCLEEMPILEAVYRQESSKTDGVIFLTINVQDSAARAQAFMKDNDYTMPVLMDAGGRAARAYGVTGIPVTFFVDYNGIIRYIKLGSFTNQDELEAALEKQEWARQ